MNKNTVIGLALAALILFGFTWYNAKQNEQLVAQQRTADSLYRAQHPIAQNQVPVLPLTAEEQAVAEENKHQAQINHYGQELVDARNGEPKTIVVENDLLKLTFLNKGAKLVAAEVKDYKKYGGAPLQLIADGSAVFDLSTFIKKDYNQVEIHTGEYYFSTDAPEMITFTEGEMLKELRMRLNIAPDAYMEYVYTIPKDNYMIGFTVNFVGMREMMANQSGFSIDWALIAPQNEKGYKNENMYTSVYYRYPGEKAPESLSAGKESNTERVNTKIDWVAFKQQFFSLIFIARDDFSNAVLGYSDRNSKDGSGNIKDFNANVSVPYYPNVTGYEFDFYLGPNKYSLLKKYDQALERLVPLGGWGIGWVNRWIVIPVFDSLSNFIGNYGLIILLLTVFIKLLIFPLTYKTYLSQAKMRLLKPEIDEINKKFPKKEDAMKKQQATMALYKKAGVSPMGGCLPLLIQFPILIAMFRFFPSSIELRQEHFLWAEDLSSYDSILQLPFNIPFYGDHVSLFTLLMAAALLVSSSISYNQTSGMNTQMPGMKFMMLYLMPVMLLVWFNNYAAALSWYFLLSNLITIGQNYLMRRFVNDKKLHDKMKSNAKKPRKKSKWQERYEDMLKAQQQQARKK